MSKLGKIVNVVEYYLLLNHCFSFICSQYLVTILKPYGLDDMYNFIESCLKSCS